MKTRNAFLYQLNISISVALFSFSLMLLGINQSYANNVSEYTSFGLVPVQAMPNPEARQYITKTKIQSSTPRQFNGELDKLTDSVVLSGHVLVFEPGHENGLWESYHQHKTLSDLEIHADTVLIRRALHLPQTNLTLFARVLRFEDDADIASINISPLATGTQALQYIKGLAGDNAGMMTLHINSLEVDNSAPLRFILHGANGQQGGKGSPGANLSASFKTYITGNIFNGLSNIYKFTNSEQASYIVWPAKGLYKRKTWGNSSTRQRNGADATKPGESGNGGNGGILRAPQLNNLVDKMAFEGGQGGVSAPFVKGGDAPEPRTLRHWSCNNTECSNTNSYTNSGGKGYSGKAGIKGNDGQYIPLNSQYSWLTKPLFSQSLRYAKDLYLYGYYQQLDGYLNAIIGIVKAYQNSEEWDQLDNTLPLETAESFRYLRQAELLQLFNEAEMLQQRLQAGLDYFGKPFGWVPGLSFEVNQTVFNQEIDTAMDVLWLTHTLQQNINNKQLRKNTAEQMVSELTDEIADLQEQFESANATLANLEPRINQLDADIIDLQQEMDAYAESFRDDAERAAVVNGLRDNMFFLSRLNPTPEGSAVLPQEGEPILSELARIGKDTAWNQAEIAMGEVDNALDCMAELGDKKKCAYREGAKLVQEKIEQTKEQGQLAIDLIRGNTTNNATVNAELQRILAEDPGWLQYAEDMQLLHERKAVLMADFIAALDAVQRAHSEIGKNQLAIDVFQEEVINTTDILDPRVIAYTEDMAQRARHRLEQYQYYMVRSYEYRLLRPYPFALDLNAVFADFCRLQAANDNNDLETVAANGCQAEQVNLNENDFKNLGVIFKEQISSIAEEIISEFNNGGGVSQDTAVEFDLQDFYIQQINQNPDGVKLNLVDDLMLFNNSEEDLRIRSIEVIDMQFSNSGTLNYVDISFKHDGISQIRKAGESYLFQHYLNSETSPIQWITRYNGNGTLQGLQNNSSSSRSLIASIIGENAANLNIFASPGAWADLTVVRTASPTSSAQGVQISGMRIRVNYEYTATENNVKTLHVAAESMTQAPPITVLTPDVKQRSNGQGNFLRSYPLQTSVALSAPLQYGQLKFEGWQENGQLVSTEPVFNVNMNSDKTVLPVYTSTLAIGGNDLTPLASATIFGGSSASRFYAGAKNNQGNYQTQFVSNEPVDIVARMDIGAEYQGQQANIYLVAQYQGQWYMKNNAQQWQPWDFSIAGLVPNQVQTLSTQLQLTVQEDLSGLPGQFAIFVGHSSADGNIHYNGQPLSFFVQ